MGLNYTEAFMGAMRGYSKAMNQSGERDGYWPVNPDVHQLINLELCNPAVLARSDGGFRAGLRPEQHHVVWSREE
jgi:hypothetical protein